MVYYYVVYHTDCTTRMRNVVLRATNFTTIYYYREDYTHVSHMYTYVCTCILSQSHTINFISFWCAVSVLFKTYMLLTVGAHKTPQSFTVRKTYKYTYMGRVWWYAQVSVFGIKVTCICPWSMFTWGVCIMIAMVYLFFKTYIWSKSCMLGTWGTVPTKQPSTSCDVFSDLSQTLRCV